MILAIYGAGYVGLVSAACFAELGHQVICLDVNPDKIAQLQAGQCPIFEEKLPELLKKQQACGRLRFSRNLSEGIQEAEVHFIATGTPSLPDGAADLSYVFSVAETIARECQEKALIVIKSTVPPGTGLAVEKHLKALGVNQNKQIDLLSNPEFLREGSAVDDFMQAERIIIGGSPNALAPLKQVYQPLVEQGIPLLSMTRSSAELAKYACNAFLASKVSYINQISRIAEAVGANIDEISMAMGTDARIGSLFLKAGIGYGGSCFPKDNRALIYKTAELGLDSSFFEAVEAINYRQKHWALDCLNNHFTDLKNTVIGIWGLAFKPGTDDLREAPSLLLIENLLKLGVVLRVYDPVVTKTALPGVLDNAAIQFCETVEAMFEVKMDALIIATEWACFKQYPLSDLAIKLGQSPLIDGRNCYTLEEVKAAGLAYYYSVGRPSIQSVKGSL